MTDRLRAFALHGIAALAGLLLLAVVLTATDLSAVAGHLSQVGWAVILMIAVYLIAFVLDSAAWQLTLRGLPVRAVWLWRIWMVRMVGEAVNHATPFAGMGGEPVKAAILNRRYGIGYGEGLASVVLARTAFVIGLIPFLLIGFALLLALPDVGEGFKWGAGAGLVGLSAGICAFFAIQRLRVTSRTGGVFARLADWKWLHRAVELTGRFEDRLVDFYAGASARFSATIGLSFANWVLGAAEIWVVFWLLGAPVTFWEAWIIEAVVQLVRVGTFFVPLSIGAQEGAFTLVVGALTGNPALGVAAAVLRRFRELVFIAAGLVMGPLIFGRAAMVTPSGERG